MNSPADLPLLTLHPVTDATHRWLAVLIEAPTADSATAPAEVLAACEGLLADSLRAVLGPLPCITPCLSATQRDPAEMTATLTAAPTLLTGPTLLRLSDATPTHLTALAPVLGGQIKLLLAEPEVSAGETAFSALVQGECSHDHASHHPGHGHGPHLALGVATRDAAAHAHATGWIWLVGNHGQDVPAGPSGKHAGSGRSVMLTLLSQITRDADDAEIEKTLKQDPNLSFQLLRLVNSAGMAMRTPATSFRQAIATLGRRQLQRWLQLLLYAQQGQGQANSLLPVAAWRAALMEALASHLGMASDEQDNAFMVGMFSRLDLLFGQPLADVIAPLGLHAHIIAALTERTGPLAPLLAVIEATERIVDPVDAAQPAGSALAACLAEAGIAHAPWLDVQVRALRWALQICREL